ncbi:glycosyltransferase [Altericista sp. CCNU0014]|uniref:glycosyltransferase n=1 Tax=Altericista sp. CCNU0014 TaxID=3082949 RepID=UPI00384C9226
MLKVSEEVWPSDPDWLEDYPKGEGRRRKAALLLIAVWCSAVALHLSARGIWISAGLTGSIALHLLRLLGTRLSPLPSPLAPDLAAEAHPFVSLVVAAKDEEAVIAALVEKLCALEYPTTRYELWVVDDNSSDRTPILLAELSQRYPNLHWLRRSLDAAGGKSGALNQVLPLLEGDFIGVFDADAQVSGDLLRAVLPYFDPDEVGAVQVRKAIANADVNFWTKGQSAEMIFDSFLHERRSALGGIGELRGNGQFVRRAALERCGGWNEDTITDDLDLTFRLHLDGWNIASVAFPFVREEGVTRTVGLWHQRNRWAEGGYQRYLDYWPLLLNNRMGYRKTLDLVIFWILQYILPTAVIPDTLMAALCGHLPVLLPLSILTSSLSFIGMFAGLNRIRHLQDRPFRPISMTFQAALGTLYMVHWLIVVSSVTARMSIRPKRFNWVKTIHVGTSHSPTS